MLKNIDQEHTTSYYAASANEVTNYPRLRGEQSADVCVIWKRMKKYLRNGIFSMSIACSRVMKLVT